MPALAKRKEAIMLVSLAVRGDVVATSCASSQDFWSLWRRMVLVWLAMFTLGCRSGPPTTVVTPDKAVEKLVYTRDGGILAVGHQDGTVVFRNGKRMTVERTVQTPDVVQMPDMWLSDIAFSPRGDLLASAYLDYGTVFLWSVADGKLVARLRADTGDVRSVAISPDGTTLAAGGRNGDIAIWDLSTRVLRKTFDAHRSIITMVEFSPLGDVLVTGSHVPDIKCWDVKSGALIHTMKPKVSAPCSSTFSPDGRFLATDGDLEYDADGRATEAIDVWDISEGKKWAELRSYELLAFSNNGVVVLPSGELIAAYRDNTLGVWDLATGKKIRTSPLPRSASAIAISPTFDVLAIGADDGKVETRRIRQIMAGEAAERN